jgi:hypothetical protein
MPAGISQSAANPAALTRPQANGGRETQAAAANNPASQTPAAAEQDQVVRAPESNPGSEGVQNQRTATDRAGQGESSGAASRPSDQPRQLEAERGLGGGIDITA